MGKAAVRSESGVHEVTMLVRNKPFKEWVTVYYDPEKTNEEKLLKLIRAKRCPRASQVRVANEKFTAMNPFTSEGEIVQLRIADVPKDKAPELVLPEGWKVFGDAKGFPDSKGKTYISVQVPAKAKQQAYKIGIRISEDKKLETEVEVVRKV